MLSEQSSASPTDTIRKNLLLATGFLLLGALTFLVSLGLTIRTYMPCPYWDQWSELNVIAAGRSSLAWLWSTHNEHRILIPRLLMLLDIKAFGGRNMSLFVEIYLVQIGEWFGIFLCLRRCSKLSRSLVLSIAGLFAFCIFHPNQAENLTWAFQVSFVLPFAIETLALLALVHLDCFRQPTAVVIAISFAPLIAALNLSGGLLLGPVIVGYAILARFRRSYILVLLAILVLTAATYLWNYHPPADDPLLLALAHPKNVFVYLLTYLGASWTKILPHKERITCFTSLVVLSWLTIRAYRDRAEANRFEWFCIAECMLVIGTALSTAFGRLQDGVGQAYAGRYQTPAMLYWAALGSLLLLRIWRSYPRRFFTGQSLVLTPMFLSVLTFPRIWSITAQHGDSLSQACSTVMDGNSDWKTRRILYIAPDEMPPDIDYLRHLRGQ